MNIDEFRRSLGDNAPPADCSELLQALWHDARGDWRRAHEIIQAASGKSAARVHAYLHRKEGDLDNAGYWHERAGSTTPAVTLEEEWETLAADLLKKELR